MVPVFADEEEEDEENEDSMRIFELSCRFDVFFPRGILFTVPWF